MTRKPVSIGLYFRRMLPFLLRYWKLLLAIFLAAGVYGLGFYARALLAKPFVEKVFMAEAYTPQAVGKAPPVEEAAPAAAAKENKVLRFLPESWRRIRWIQIIASFFDKDYHVVGADVREYFHVICYCALGLSVLLGVGLFLKLYLARLVINLVTVDLRNHVYARLIHFEVNFFDRKRSGDLLARVTADLEMARRATDQLVGNVIDKPIIVVTGFVVCLFLSWELTLVCFVAMPLFLTPIVILAKKIRRGATARQQRLGDLTDAMVQTFNGIRVIKAFGLERLERDDFAVKNRQFFRKDMSVARARALSRSISDFLYTAGTAVILLILGSIFLSKTGMVGSDELKNLSSKMVTFFLVIGSMYQPLKLLIKAFNLFQESAAGAERLFEVTDHVSGIVERPGAGTLDGVRQGLAYREVRFRYDTDDVLRGIDLEVPVGATVAVVGPSGAGKTTLLDLIPRFYDVSEGQVQIDGRDVRDYTLESLYRNIAVVQQDPFLFNTTIRENIRLGRPGATDAEVEAAARAAQVAAFVEQLPEGYDTPCGERGTLLSGGERQRVTIARAMLKDAPILLLDEATSSLDTRSEREVQRALDELMKGRTTLVIAHRLSTVRHADLIVVLRDGKIVEQGTHEQLLVLGSVYAQLHQLQHPEEEGA
jgi:subfamily B ATP-binding cassette protein MsbA